jgi:hypothetical protein
MTSAIPTFTLHLPCTKCASLFSASITGETAAELDRLGGDARRGHGPDRAPRAQLGAHLPVLRGGRVELMLPCPLVSLERRFEFPDPEQTSPQTTKLGSRWREVVLSGSSQAASTLPGVTERVPNRRVAAVRRSRQVTPRPARHDFGGFRYATR